MCLVVFAGSALEDRRFVLVDRGRPGSWPLVGSPFRPARPAIRRAREPRVAVAAT